MKVGTVAGTVVSTINTALFDRRLLLCDVEGLADVEGYTICIDVVDAGVGDRVLILDEGNSARQILGLDTGEIRAVVVGIIDEVHLER